MRVYLWGEAARYGNYQRAVERAGGEIRFGGDPSDCGALLLPGGGDMEPWRYGQADRGSRSLEPERDRVELALLERFTGLGLPVLGICRGMQVINVYFGGTLRQDIPRHGTQDGRDSLHAVETAPSFLLPLCGVRCVVNSAHHQAVERMGTGLQAVQWAADGVVEALCHRDFPVWGVQWHPERLADGPGDALFRSFLQAAQKTQWGFRDNGAGEKKVGEKTRKSLDRTGET